MVHIVLGLAISFAGPIIAAWIMKKTKWLHLIGGKEERFENIDGVEQIPYLPINDFIGQVQGAEFCVLP